jgi:hypothetical protein
MSRRAGVDAKSKDVPPGGSSVPAQPTEHPARRAAAKPESNPRAPDGSGYTELYEVIRAADTDRTVEARILAMRLMVKLHTEKRCSLLVPILAKEIAQMRRRHVRGVEQKVRFTGEASAADGGWLQLLPEGFAIPDGRFVTWAEATVEDHEARIEWLQGQIEALGQDVDRHQQAIKLIREHGVTCLAEVEDAA